MSRTARPLLALAGTTALLLGPLAALGSAHVTVQAPGAAQGGYTKLVFRVPSEKDVATTKVEVAFPQDTPIASVRVKPHAGWTYTLTKGKPAVPLENHGTPVTEVVQRVTWTVAAGNKGIAATEFEEFEVSAGPLPKVEQVVFKALQTYANGEVVRWIDEKTDATPEPEKPAPVLALAAASETTAVVPAQPVADVTSTGDSAASAEDDGPSGVAIAALVTAAAALAVGLFSLVTGRRRA